MNGDLAGTTVPRTHLAETAKDARLSPSPTEEQTVRAMVPLSVVADTHRELRPRRRRLAATTLLAPMVAAAACNSSSAIPETTDFPVRFLVSNELIAPVTISIDGTTYSILTSGKDIGLTVSSRAQWLTWTSAKPAGSDGAAIPDDIGEVRVPISGINGALEIRNVINDQTYVTARIFNTTNAPALIGVSDGVTVSCAGVLPAAADSVKGFVQIGYYRLLPATEVRAYRAASRCSGPYVAWPSSQLAAFTARSGLVTLLLESAP